QLVSVLADSTNLYGAAGFDISGRYAYVSMFNSDSSKKKFSVIDLSGLDAVSANIGSLEAGSMQVRQNAVMNQNLWVNGGVNIGMGGLYSAGPFAISATNTPSYI